jgi:carotenoid 1,2-hydratase
MTERGERHVSRSANSFAVGPSTLRWDANGLSIAITERGVPWPLALRGNVHLKPGHFCNAPVMLDDSGKHFWQAVAPQARISVAFENPQLSWEGAAYHDMNWGDEPLESTFKSWTWARAASANGLHVLYDVQRRDGSNQSFGYSFADGIVKPRNVPAHHALKRGLWGMERTVPSENAPRLISTLEDAPFYMRSLVELTLDGAACTAFHESLSLARFRHPVVQMMLPFRMPRVA